MKKQHLKSVGIIIFSLFFSYQACYYYLSWIQVQYQPAVSHSTKILFYSLENPEQELDAVTMRYRYNTHNPINSNNNIIELYSSLIEENTVIFSRDGFEPIELKVSNAYQLKELRLYFKPKPTSSKTKYAFNINVDVGSAPDPNEGFTILEQRFLTRPFWIDHRVTFFTSQKNWSITIEDRHESVIDFGYRDVFIGNNYEVIVWLTGINDDTRIDVVLEEGVGHPMFPNWKCWSHRN